MQAEAVKATQRRTVWNVLRRNLSLTAGCLILLCVVFTALFPGLIASQSPTDQNLTAMLAAPSAEHIWGTDELGRDIFARVIWGTRYDLVIGLAAASVPFIVGTLIGLFTAYFGGILDTLFMRLVDVMMSFPVIVLIIACIIGLIYAGGFFGGACSGDFIAAFANTDAFVGLPWGGIIALVLTVIYLVARKVLSFKEAMACVPKGFVAMVPPIIILTLAVSLKAMINSLGADVYVHDLMFAASKSLYSMLPAVIFVVACILAFASGTSWGTFGILIPIVTAVFPADSNLLIIGISACCAGAVCGDHCSPISDTTIMASAGAQCEHLNHVTTQLPYAVTVAIVSFVGFIVAGFVQNVFVTWAVGIVLLLGALFLIRAIERKKAA